MRIRFVLLTLAASLAALVPAANANDYNLFCSGVACGTVTISDISGGVFVDVDMTKGYSIQAKANNSFTLNTIGGLSPSPVTAVLTPEFGTIPAQFATTVNDGAGKFTFGVDHFTTPHGETSTAGIEFNLLGISTSQLLPNDMNNVVAVHFCSPGADTTSCPSPTGFTKAVPVSAVPEPSSLLLLGSGLLGLAPVLRRKMFPGRKLMLGT